MSKALGYLGLTVAVLLWGISFISIDILLQVMTVGEINVIRFILSNGVLWLIHFARMKKMSFHRKDLPLVALAGILGTAGYYYFENLGLTYISPGMVSIVTGAIPIITLVVAMLFFGKKTPFKNIFLVFLSFGGIVVLMKPWGEAGMTNVSGVGVVMLANVFWALYTLFNEGLNRKYDKLQLLTLQYSFGMVAFLGFYFYGLSSHPERQMLDLSLVLGSEKMIGHLVFVCIFVSVGAYFFYNYALAHIGVMISALFINVVPVVTLIISVGIGYEPLTFNKIVGCLMVVVAIFFIDDI